MISWCTWCEQEFEVEIVAMGRRGMGIYRGTCEWCGTEQEFED